MEKQVKVLKAEKFAQVIAVLEGAEKPELVEFIEAELARHVAKQEKAKERAAKKRAESDVLVDVVYDVLVELGEAATRDEVTAKVAEVYEGELEITAPRVGARLTKLVEEGKVEKESKTINKARKMVYTAVGTAPVEEADVDVEDEAVEVEE